MRRCPCTRRSARGKWSWTCPKAWTGANWPRAVAVTATAQANLQVRVHAAQAWSPDHPHLYRLRLSLRDFELKDGQFLLNGERTFLLMVLDQGYWPQSMLAAPSDDALRADVDWVKRYGFNGVRKHQ